MLGESRLYSEKGCMPAAHILSCVVLPCVQPLLFLLRGFRSHRTIAYLLFVQLRAFALDLGGSTLEDPTDLEIVVVDQNDNRPAFLQDVFRGRILEGAIPGEVGAQPHPRGGPSEGPNPRIPYNQRTRDIAFPSPTSVLDWHARILRSTAELAIQRLSKRLGVRKPSLTLLMSVLI